jgi:hypothetical protein
MLSRLYVGRRVDVMRVDVSVRGHGRVAVSLSDAFSVRGAVSVVMWTRFVVGWRVDVIRVDFSVCDRKRVAVCVSGSVGVCGAVSVVMRSRLDVGRLCLLWKTAWRRGGKWKQALKTSE